MSISNFIIVKSIRKFFEPQPLFVYFGKLIPGFARINRQKKGWNIKERTKLLSNGSSYLAPPYEKMKGHFVLLNDWPIKIRIKQNNQFEIITFSIPKGTPTDFASIPRVLHSFVSPLDNSIYSAVLHDYLYRNPSDEVPRSISRARADTIFYYGLKAKGKNRLIALLFFWGVKVFGRSSYKRH